MIKLAKSHPAGVRGLKHQCNLHIQNDHWSHPAGVRGLKPPSRSPVWLLPPRRTPQGCVD